MTDGPEQDRNNLDFLRERLIPIDREIPVPESVRASQLLARLESAPPLRVAHRSYWKQSVCAAAALVLVLGGVFLSRWPGSGGLSAAPQMAPQSSMAGAAAAPAEAKAADQALAAAELESAPLPSGLYAADYEAVRLALTSVQGEDDYYQSPETLNGTGPDPGTGGGAEGGKGGGGAEEKLAQPRSAASWALPSGGVSLQGAAGPEESDIVKMDGGLIYYLMTPVGAQKQEIKIVEAENLNLLSTIEFTSDTAVSGLFVRNNRLAVMYQEDDFYTLPVYERMQGGEPVQSGYAEVPAVTLEIFDIGTDGQAFSLSKYTQQGDYVSARLVEDSVLLVTDSDSLCNARNPAVADEMLVPAVRDEQVSPEIIPIDPGSICIPAEITSDRFAVVSSVSLSNLASNSARAVLGGVDQVYASMESVYFASSGPESQGSSSLVRFSLDGGGLELASYGTVPGVVRSPLAMQEQDGILRVVTDGSQSLTLYTFDQSLSEVGRAELPAGESAGAVYYLEQYAYLASGDEFYVVDLSDPASPSVLGTAPLPGSAEYLQPAGAGTLLAVGHGKDAGGLEVSLLDLSNPLKPAVRQSHKLGVAGSYSLALRTHLAALSWDNGLGIPVTLYQDAADGVPRFDQDGFALYEIRSGELVQLGLLSPGQYPTEDALYAAGGEVQRGLRSDDMIYLLSRQAITAYSLDTLGQTVRLAL